jgi:hypothetical protein
MHNHHMIDSNTKVVGQFSSRSSGQIHESLWLSQHSTRARRTTRHKTNAGGRSQGTPMGAFGEGCPGALGQDIHRHETEVVPVAGVVRPGITQADD